MGFTLPADIILLIAQHPLPRPTLASCCLVSRECNAIFKPLLYRSLVVNQAVGSEGKFTTLSGSPREPHLLRSLEINPLGDWDFATLWPEPTTLANLESFSASLKIFYLSQEDYNGLWNTVDRRALKELSLHFPPPDIAQFSHPFSFDLDPDFQYNTYLRGTCDLRRLGVRGGLWCLDTTKELAAAIIRSPNLRALGLSVHGAYYWPHFEQQTLTEFFPILLAELQTLRESDKTTSTPPLPPLLELDELTLGLGTLPSDERLGLTYSSLSTLTDLSKLRVLNLDNAYSGPNVSSIDPDDEYLAMDPTYFQNCTSLESICVDVLSPCVLSLLNSLRSQAPRLTALEVREWGFRSLFSSSSSSESESAWFLEQVETLAHRFAIPEPGYDTGSTGFVLWGTWNRFRENLINMPNLRHLNHVTCSKEAAEMAFQLHDDAMHTLGRRSRFCSIRPCDPVDGVSGSFVRRWKNPVPACVRGGGGAWGRVTGMGMGRGRGKRDSEGEKERDWDVVVDLCD